MMPSYGFDQETGLLNIPTQDRWLKGEEYGFLLRHYKTYNFVAGYGVHDKKQDPLVYENPFSKRLIRFRFNLNLDGMIYYIKGLHLREFGFPRIRNDREQQFRKDFKWKKTNFVTDLPKHSPIARYLVAKTSNQINIENHYFMHCSVLYRGNQMQIFIHIFSYRVQQ